MNKKTKTEGALTFLKELTLYIEDVVIQKQEKLAEHEVDEIVKKLLPKIDEIISKKIKIHLKFLSSRLLERLKLNEEE